MKQCPLCKRTYSGELNYCLDDGTHLLVQEDGGPTAIYPQPSPPPPPARRQRSYAIWVVAAIVLVVAVVGLVGGAAAIAWYSSQDNSNAQNVNSSPRTLYATPSPTAIAIASPSPSPELTNTSVTEQSLATGTYQCEVNRTFKSEDKEGSGTVKVQLTFNLDGTYLEQGYVTIHGTAVTDRLGMEERGRYTQEDGFLLFKERLTREYNMETESWSSWVVPKDGSEDTEKIRNVTTTTFQIYDTSEKSWFTFAKL